ncbi:LysM peptidoglycan-binding domain-containing protein [Kutzneria chonburiensis]|uniref:LysM peptidoglycan-binding domain-containing protein n=1 Tax=Kutzneria chonburiensis TaxID=1483604 RepID=A0ABV6N4L6_9PSEU|nr:LysM peptidoglycan-binding domain-containing protein [Kutzneria chonburiensis]
MDYGIDVSMYNAIADANAVRANNITYAWCKATEGVGWVDPSFAAKVAQLRAAGIVVGAYHFMRAGDPVAQAQAFRQVAGDAGCLNVGALMPMADMEAADVQGNANDMVTRFYDALGVQPVDCYGNVNWWTNYLAPGAWGNRNILGHIAQYNGDPGNTSWSYDHAAVHQHTSAGVVSGIPGNVDRDATLGAYSLQAITIGNTSPPQGPVDAPTQNRSDADTWTVAAGDTLSRIASAWGVTVSAVATANAIPNADLIYVGQVIHRPGTAGAAPAPAASADTYTVVSGDTLSGIAAAHGTSVATLVQLNGISNPDRIYPGQVIQLPTATVSAAPQQVYVVQSGDTLGAIAARLGYPGGYPALAARNGISNPDRIYPGQPIYY